MRVSLVLSSLLTAALLVVGDAAPEAASEAISVPESTRDALPLPEPASRSASPESETLPRPEDPLKWLEVAYDDEPEVSPRSTTEAKLGELLARLMDEQLAKRVPQPLIQPNATNPTTNVSNPANVTNSTTPSTNVTLPANGTNTTIPSLPVNSTNPDTNVTLPPNTNVTLPVNVTTPNTNVTLPVNVTTPNTNVTLPVNVTTPNTNITLPTNGTDPNTNVTLPTNGTTPSTNVTLPTNGTVPNTNVTVPTNGTSPNTNVTLPTNGTIPNPPNTNVTLPTNGTTPGNGTTPTPCPPKLPYCPNYLRVFLYPFGRLPVAKQLCEKVQKGTYKYQTSYAKMSPWIRKDVKLFCACIAPKHKKRDLEAVLDVEDVFEKRDSETAEDLGDVFEKRDASQIANLVSEAHRISEKKAASEGKSDNDDGSQSFFGPSRLQKYGHGGSLVRRRKTVTVVEEEFEK